MQLKHIKLAGFKSFVDPTKIAFPTNLVGVVGPNGCGKSNVIDAVRWVLGELSAKNLRGDSMADVIFNGSDLRKPAGQCSIELLFDNSSGKIGGEYSSFNEISIKRVMTRDSQSNYFINSTKCRRKDVQDLFLGTGLGPSSYAIIEQGMVSSLVSAKPEDLRTHIEEAAGVSKYRERRRETESRIKRTKENLSRVKDIKDEISRLIKRLENQAKAAEKYKKLKEDEAKTELDIAIVFSLKAKNSKDQLQNNLDALNRDYKIKDSEVKTKQSKIDEFRTQNEAVLSSYEESQKNYYSIGAEVARNEQDIHNLKNQKKQFKEELSRVEDLHKIAIEKAEDFENLSPKEKALRLLDRIINTLNENGFVKDRVKENANELKDLLKNIFQIASEQTKSISADYIERKTKLTKDINDIDKSIETKTELLNDLILNSSIAEEALNKIRKEQSAVDSEVKKLESERSIAELDLRSISEKITNLRVELKSHEIQLDSSNKKINQAGINIDTINFDNYENLDVEELQKNIEILQEKILKLGAINLAAPNEIAEELKRKEELDSQYDELIDALEKLSAAIKKIDEETKTRFKNSFDAVNARIKEVFPKLFGGGFAELSLTENDTLNAGVVLMARPPGKKNTSISQLSGGEKALTALALVFSIFELNPAPFCMLDEVDAPLDDLNTMRFINMVEEMSKTIQFIFITHNKVSMERSDHLMGVTMQEAGVSRMVSVDVNQALEFAET